MTTFALELQIDPNTPTTVVKALAGTAFGGFLVSLSVDPDTKVLAPAAPFLPVFTAAAGDMTANVQPVDTNGKPFGPSFVTQPFTVPDVVDVDVPTVIGATVVPQ